MNHWPREMTKRLQSVEESSKKNKKNISQVRTKVRRLKRNWRVE
jgi:hypothetical protein